MAGWKSRANILRPLLLLLLLLLLRLRLRLTLNTDRGEASRRFCKLFDEKNVAA
jgi:hypothetical protein